MLRPINVQPTKKEVQTRTTGFRLYNAPNVPPTIIIQPVNGYVQTSYNQSITPQNSTIDLLEGTQFGFKVSAVNESNTLNDPNNKLQYVWKRNETPIFELNNLNSGSGTDTLFMSPATVDATGIYTCEITNLNGTSTTQPLTINVYNPNNIPGVGINLIQNGDAEAGLEGWTSTGNAKTEYFIDDITTNFGSGLLYGNFDNEYYRGNFKFSKSNNWANFPFIWNKLNEVNFDRTQLPTILQYASQFPANLILNEDWATKPYAAFFPSPSWIDRYNRNDTLRTAEGLESEFESDTFGYFTRTPIEFEKYGGKIRETLTQEVDVTSYSKLIDGNVLGVRQMKSEFFAYIGCGLTKIDIKIKVGVDRFGNDNFMVLDYQPQTLEDWEAWFKGNVSTFPKTAMRDGYELIVEPKAEDQTEVLIEYLNNQRTVIANETIKGPDAKDVFAVKEKTFIPLALTFLATYCLDFNGVEEDIPVKIYDQQYTTLKSIIYSTRPNDTNPQVNKLEELAPTGSLATTASLSRPTPRPPLDSSISALINEYGNPFKYAYKIYGNIGTANNPQYDLAQGRGLAEKGASAFFGVESSFNIPVGTRFIRVNAIFTHTSPIPQDATPEIKGWTDREIYANYFGQINKQSIGYDINANRYLSYMSQTTGNSRRLYRYGNPRCGITKMKLQLIPNSIEFKFRNPNRVLDYPTYAIPSNNIWYLAKLDLDNNTHNTAGVGRFAYNIIQVNAPGTLTWDSSQLNDFYINQQISGSFSATNIQSITTTGSLVSR